MNNTVLYKIFYDERSLNQIGSDFVPLHNRGGPEYWFELWPILNFLECNALSENTWYGFLSPKFPAKTTLSMESIHHLLAQNPDADVALFSSAWVDIVRFRNAWVQGECHHPGLIACFESFLKAQGHVVDVTHLVGDFETTVFSNYVIAKKSFWLEWSALARAYFDYVTDGGDDLADNRPTVYHGPQGTKLHTFVQERLACWVLQSGHFQVVHADYPNISPRDRTHIFDAKRAMHLTLGMAEFTKHLARKSNLRIFLAFTWVLVKVASVLFRLQFRRRQQIKKGRQ